MSRRSLSVQDAFLIKRGQSEFCVTLCGLTNNTNGNRRYEATVVDLGNLSEDGASGAFRYRFTGHFMTPREEAEWALDHCHLKDG